ncbi:NAD(P)/FAD-dependent oxidoreductase [Amycolatopsis sacchari]|uniref:NAD(P)/FAD-dependent oxidoreductase n=1 Tax=Amycolatopsis sacchari TaxID=115433 RepID=UPI003EB781A7
MRAIVIGAGVVGAAVAGRLAARGAEVTILEARTPGAGTTGTSFAWVNSGNKEPESYFALNHAGVRAHHEFAGGPAPWFFPTGNLEWANGAALEVLLARVAKLESRDYPVRRLTAKEALELEPDLAPQPAGTEFVYYPEEAHVLPALLLARFLGEARDAGVRIVNGAEVVEVGGGVVRTADGSRYSADVVVSCAGRWTAGVAQAAGVAVPMADPEAPGSATVGFLATTAPVPVRLSRVLTTPRLNVRPDGGGRLLLQGLDLDGEADPAVAVPADGKVGAELVERLPTLLTGAEGAVVEKVRVGQRAMPADGLTVAGFATEGFYVVATHSGITLAPLLARLVADEVHGADFPELADFRPGRFVPGRTYEPLRPARLPSEQ